MDEGKVGKPIFKDCPRCNVLTQWYWTYEENEFERSLKAVECSCEIDPLELGFESYEAWNMDPNNFYPKKPKKNVLFTNETEDMAIVPPSRRVSRSSI